MNQDKVLRGAIVQGKGLSNDLDLQTINDQFARRKFDHNQIFVAQTVLCHNAIDQITNAFQRRSWKTSPAQSPASRFYAVTTATISPWVSSMPLKPRE